MQLLVCGTTPRVQILWGLWWSDTFWRYRVEFCLVCLAWKTSGWMTARSQKKMNGNFLCGGIWKHVKAHYIDWIYFYMNPGLCLLYPTFHIYLSIHFCLCPAVISALVRLFSMFRDVLPSTFYYFILWFVWLNQQTFVSLIGILNLLFVSMKYRIG